MTTMMTVLRTDGTREEIAVCMAAEPSLEEIHDAVDPHLNGGDLERVAVLFEGRPVDMFVDETGTWKGLPRNEAATAIYRAYWLSTHPGDDPESLPAIYGPALVFSRRVWF